MLQFVTGVREGGNVKQWHKLEREGPWQNLCDGARLHIFFI